MQIEDNKTDPLTYKRIFDIVDARFTKKNILYEHLYNSYNDFIDNQVINFLKTNDNIFDENKVGDKVYRYKFKFDNIHVRPPLNENGLSLMYPMDARDRKSTYSVKIIAKVSQIQEIYDLNKKEIISSKVIGNIVERENILSLPVMVNSKYCSLQINRDYNKRDCEYDPGGYFIVNGSEKIVLCIEKMSPNKPLVFIKKDSGIISYQVQINSLSPNPNIMMQGIIIKMKKNFDITIRVPIFNEVSVFTLMRALGLEKDIEIVRYITYNDNDIDMINILKIAIDLSKTEGKKLILSKEDAYYSLCNKVRVVKKYTDKDKKLQYEEKKEHLEGLLRNAFLPHISADRHVDVFKAKAYYLGFMINKLLNCILGRIKPDDRDSFTNKRIDLPGDLLFELFKQHYKKMLNECNKFFKKRSTNHETPLNIINQIKPSTVEQGLKSSLLTGNWGKKKGVAQMYPRLTFLQSISVLRRVDAPSSDASTMKLTGPRHLHPSQTGFLSAVESPEHTNIGLVKHLSLLGSITIGSAAQNNIIYKMLIENDKFTHLDNHQAINLPTLIKVFLNGEWIGTTNKPYDLYTDFKTLKQNSIISNMVGIIYDIERAEIRLYTDTGRLYRPVLSVKNNEVILTNKMIEDVINNKNKNTSNTSRWEELIMKYPEAIDFIDSDEQFYTHIAYDKNIVNTMKEREKLVFPDDNNPIINRYDESLIQEFTHCEIHPFLVEGMMTGLIPFANHNQGPRNIYSFAQGKQAMGIYTSNYRDRLDISYILYHTQLPLVSTRISKYIHTDILPCGENAIVMIGTYTGYNQEDSLIFNKTSIDRGLFRSSSLKKWESKIEKNQSTSQDDIFMKPDPSKLAGIRHAVYDKLNDKGYVPEETVIEYGDVIIGKVTPIQPAPNSNKCFKDSSEIYKVQKPAIIDKVFKDIQDTEGYDMIKIRTRSERIPEIGDKFTSRHAQKGTVGLTLHQSDMPFTKEGIYPDIIMNANAIPSRMTIGQLVEALVGKVAAVKGMLADGTPFNDIDIEHVKTELEKLGYEKNATEYLYNGMTGQRIKIPIFIGPTYYQRLKHLVSDKIHSRSRGPITMLTHQPPEGRSKDGGLRFGEMERDSIISHGMSKFLKERLLDTSDAYSTYVCDVCGLFAQRRLKKENKMYPTDLDSYSCNACKNQTRISKIIIPYAFKLLIQELMSMNIASRIRTKQYTL
jgi:DNA-directed RNA polymerase II subunit RPB2